MTYNGLEKPDIWPPKLNFDASRNVTPVNYISPSNGVINIDVGRQLFVDDFLIEKTSLSRVFYSPQKSDKNPILFLPPRLNWIAVNALSRHLLMMESGGTTDSEYLKCGTTLAGCVAQPMQRVMTVCIGRGQTLV